MPTLSQIQTYVKMQRAYLGIINYILKKQVDEAILYLISLFKATQMM